MLLNCGVGEDFWEWVPWTARRSNQSILKEICLEYSLKRLILKLKLQYSGHLMQRTDIGKDPDAGKDWRWQEKGTTEDEIFGWHHQLNVCEFEEAPGVGDGQGSLACCSPWGCKESDMAEGLNWLEEGRQHVVMNIKREKKTEEEISQYCQDLSGGGGEGRLKCHFMWWLWGQRPSRVQFSQVEKMQRVEGLDKNNVLIVDYFFE